MCHKENREAKSQVFLPFHVQHTLSYNSYQHRKCVYLVAPFLLLGRLHWEAEWEEEQPNPFHVKKKCSVAVVYS